MSSYNSVAVVGTGALGQAIVENLLSLSGVTTILLRRPESKSEYAPSNLTIETLDLLDVDALTAVFKKHKTQVVVSAVGVSAYDEQIPIAKALKAAGGKLFIPSEFGFPTIGAKSEPGLSRKEYNKGTFGVKYEVAEEISKFIPISRIFTNAFSEYVGFLTNLQSGSFQIVGKGDTPASFTSIKDIAYFVAKGFTSASPDQVENKTFHISSEKKTLNEIAALYGGKVKVEHIDTFPAETANADFLNGLHYFFDKGIHSGPDAGSGNKLVPDYKWTTLKETLGL